MRTFKTRLNLQLEKSILKDEKTDIASFDADEDIDAAKLQFDDPDTIDQLKTKMDNSDTMVVDETEAQQHAETVTMKEKLMEWVDVLEAFVEFINGNDDHSMQKLLAAAPSDSLFNKIKVSEGKKISRAAVDLSALKEALKSYVVSN